MYVAVHSSSNTYFDKNWTKDCWQHTSTHIKDLRFSSKFTSGRELIKYLIYRMYSNNFKLSDFRIYRNKKELKIKDFSHINNLIFEQIIFSQIKKIFKTELYWGLLKLNGCLDIYKFQIKDKILISSQNKIDFLENYHISNVLKISRKTNAFSNSRFIGNYYLLPQIIFDKEYLDVKCKLLEIDIKIISYKSLYDEWHEKLVREKL